MWRTRFGGALWHTCIFFAIHMIVQNSLGLLFANLLSSDFKGRNFFRTIIFTPATLSVLVTGFLWTLILNPNWGAVNKILIGLGLKQWALPWLGRENLALPVISLTSAWQWVGMPTVMFLAGLMGISDELLEAARIDGASEWSIFWKIKFPLLKPIIGIVAILTFVDNFNAFDVIYAMAGARGEPSYSTDLLATLFYRTGIAGEHPVGQPARLSRQPDARPGGPHLARLFRTAQPASRHDGRKAVHARQFDGQKNQVGLYFRGESNAFESITGLNNLIAVVFKNISEQVHVIFIVFDKQQIHALQAPASESQPLIG
jgi:ABC-type sugar transport system permease subunit